MDHRLKNKHLTRFGTGQGQGIGVNQLPRSIQSRRSVIAKAYLSAQPSIVNKPGRKLGAPWMDQFVSSRISVNLCDVCARIYGPSLTNPKYGYRPQTSTFKLGDCDGCGGTGQPERLISYYPSETYEERKLKPNPQYTKKGVL